MVILLHFAYRKEAQFFLKEWELEKLHDSNLELYSSKELKNFILITEEGIEGNLVLATRALSFLQLKLNTLPDLILNLGVAGALSNKLQLHEVVSAKIAIRTNTEDSAYFQSFELAKLPSVPSKSFKEIFAAISADKRINREESRVKLLQIGEFVDRELWAIAFIAAEYKIPCATLKIISDFAQEDSCQLVVKNNEILAQHLFDEVFPYLQELQSAYQSAYHGIGLHYTKGQNLFEPQIFKHHEFYFTQTQKHQLKKLYLGHKIKEIKDENILLLRPEVQEIIRLETTPKKRASELLFYLFKKLNPFLVHHQEELKKILAPFKHPKITFDLDPKLEEETLSLHMEVQNEKDYHDFKNILNDFQYDQFRKLIFGNSSKGQN